MANDFPENGSGTQLTPDIFSHEGSIYIKDPNSKGDTKVWIEQLKPTLHKIFLPDPTHQYREESCLCGYRYIVDITKSNELGMTIIAAGDEEFKRYYLSSPTQRHILECPKCKTLKMGEN